MDDTAIVQPGHLLLPKLNSFVIACTGMWMIHVDVQHVDDTLYYRYSRQEEESSRFGERNIQTDREWYVLFRSTVRAKCACVLRLTFP